MGFEPVLHLHGGPFDRPPVWVTWTGPRHIPIVFPDGFYATFEPGLRVHSPDGRVVAREGDDVSSDALAWPGLAICAGPTVTNVYLLSDVD